MREHRALSLRCIALGRAEAIETIQYEAGYLYLPRSCIALGRAEAIETPAGIILTRRTRFVGCIALGRAEAIETKICPRNSPTTPRVASP